MGLAMLLMTAEEAASLRAVTAGAENRLEPRAIEAGLHAGLHALPLRVMADAAFAWLADAFAAMARAELEPGDAWPDAEEAG